VRCGVLGLRFGVGGGMKREEILEKIRIILKKNGIQKAYLFGSFAREEKKYNDIDLAIVPPKGKFSLIDLVHIQNLLEEETGKKFDVVTLRSINVRLKPFIDKDLKDLKI